MQMYAMNNANSPSNLARTRQTKSNQAIHDTYSDVCFGSMSALQFWLDAFLQSHHPLSLSPSLHLSLSFSHSGWPRIPYCIVRITMSDANSMSVQITHVVPSLNEWINKWIWDINKIPFESMPKEWAFCHMTWTEPTHIHKRAHSNNTICAK